MSNQPHLLVAGVSHSYGDEPALRNVDLEIGRGELVTIVGPSGCGKTTLLRIIAGFIQPTKGRVLLDGNDLLQSPPNRRPTNMVFQRPTLFPHLDVRSNIEFGLKLRKTPRRSRESRVHDAVELFGLGGLEHRRPFELSGGQVQRVALARALVNDPEVLLLDEPLAALDRRIRLELEVEIRRVHRETGSTILYVTHDQRVALGLGDRLVVLRRGEVAQIGRPEDIYRAPVSPYVARFVGDANVLSGEVVRVGTGYVASVAGLPLGAAGPPARPCVIVVRAEKLVLTECGRSDALHAVVVDRVYRGNTVHYRCRLEATREAVGVEVAASSPDHLVGDRVGVRSTGEVVVLARDYGSGPEWGTSQ